MQKNSVTVTFTGGERDGGQAWGDSWREKKLDWVLKDEEAAKGLHYSKTCDIDNLDNNHFKMTYITYFGGRNGLDNLPNDSVIMCTYGQEKHIFEHIWIIGYIFHVMQY